MLFNIGIGVIVFSMILFLDMLKTRNIERRLTRLEQIIEEKENASH